MVKVKKRKCPVCGESKPVNAYYSHGARCIKCGRTAYLRVKKDSRLMPAGRACEEAECKTVLSRYNKGARCSIHEIGSRAGTSEGLDNAIRAEYLRAERTIRERDRIAARR